LGDKFLPTIDRRQRRRILALLHLKAHQSYSDRIENHHADMMKHFYPGNDYAYRFIPVWTIFWSAVALFFLWRLYQDWKKLPVHD
jgi:hypothetical protein